MEHLFRIAKHITSPNIKFETAIKELTSSPIYKNLIISEDSKTFGIVVYLKENKKYLDLISQKVGIARKPQS